MSNTFETAIECAAPSRTNAACATLQIESESVFYLKENPWPIQLKSRDYYRAQVFHSFKYVYLKTSFLGAAMKAWTSCPPQDVRERKPGNRLAAL